jgi:ElaB/YqjD/DUF883 family membrane-anchored ribosome-binding protein
MQNRLHNHFKTKKPEADVRSAAAETVAEAPSAEGLTQRASRSLASHPAIAIGAAFAVGLLIGKWVKR